MLVSGYIISHNYKKFLPCTVFDPAEALAANKYIFAPPQVLSIFDEKKTMVPFVVAYLQK